MKKNLYIYFFGLLLFALLLISCGRAMRENEMAKMKSKADTIIVNNANMLDAFEADSLSPEQLTLFQQRGQQKLEDFINYIELISNKKYDRELRLAACQQALELFTDSSVEVKISIRDTTLKSQTIAAFLKEVYISDFDSVKIKTDLVAVAQPQLTGKPLIYSGPVKAKVNMQAYKKAQLVIDLNSTHTASTLICKTEKKFGNESKRVWTVSIGKIN